MPLQSTAHKAVIQPEAFPGFVAPPLRMPDSTRVDFNRPIILVSAPGAVGKSELARHLAAGHATALWDLSRIALGDNSFLGTLASAFGAGRLGDILQHLQDGRALFIFDAFDEAEILSGWDRVESFVKEIWSYVSESKYVTAILLARTETASLLDLLLSDLGGERKTHTLVEIDFFDEEGATRFVRRQLSDIYKIEAHQQHEGPFNLALESTFQVLSKSLGCETGEQWDTSLCRSFLGYAPVLQAIAAHLSEYTNYQDALADMRAVAAGTQDDLLQGIMKSLTTREQGKFVSPLRDRPKPTDAEDPNWNSLYTEQEQLRRIFVHVSGLDDPAAPNDTLPGWLREQYGEALQSFFPNHPFLRGREFAGPAFRDYVYATLLPDPEIGPLVEAWLDEPQPLFVPTPLFAEFYKVAAEGNGAGTHAGYLYESVISKFGLEHAALTVFVSPDLGSGLHNFALVSDDPESNDEGFHISLVVDGTTPLLFRQRLRGAAVSVHGRVVLSASAQFELGDVELQADRIDIRTPILLVRAFRGQERVSVQSNQTATHDSLKVEVRPGADFRVNWPGAQKYPWSAYFDSNLFSEQPDREGALLALRRILIWFRKDRKEELGRYKELIDNVIIGHSEVRQQMRDFLLAKGVLKIDGRQYTVSTDDAQRYGLNWSALRASKPTAALIPLLDEFLEGVPPK